MKTQKLYNIIYWGVNVPLVLVGSLSPNPWFWTILLVQITFITAILVGYWLGGRQWLEYDREREERKRERDARLAKVWQSIGKPPTSGNG